MILIKENIEGAYDDVSPDKLVFKDAKRNRKEKIFLVILLIAFIPITFLLFDQRYAWLFGWLFLAWTPMPFLFFYGLINRYAKKQLLLLMKIEPSKGFFTHWANEAYHERKLNLFLERLRERKILTDSSDDIEIAKQCSDFFDAESKNLFRKAEFVLGGVLLALLVPVWNQYLTVLFRKNDAHVENVLLFSLGIVAVIFLTLTMFLAFKWSWNDYINKRSNKYKDISRLLHVIHLNMKIKYSAGKENRFDNLKKSILRKRRILS